MFITASRERIASLPMGLTHAPKVTYDRPSEKYVATCPGCDWACGPDWGARVHEAAHDHNRKAGA